MPTLKTVTLGCKVNQYETEYVRGGLLGLGYREAGDGEPADLYIVNTCTVTSDADMKSRKTIRQIARKNPQAEMSSWAAAPRGRSVRWPRCRAWSRW